MGEKRNGEGKLGEGGGFGALLWKWGGVGRWQGEKAGGKWGKGWGYVL